MRMEQLLGCWHEAQRADIIARELLRLRDALYPDYEEHITTVLKEVETTSRLLRDLYDLFPIYRARVPIIIYHLQTILPCLCKTLMDMKVTMCHPELTPAAQWMRMYDRLSDQGGMSLATRFVMYNEFLVHLVRLLSRSLLYDPTSLELLRIRILRLRSLRGIPAPPIQPQPEPPRGRPLDNQRPHWATKIFEDVPHSTTSLKHRRISKCFGPSMSEARQGIKPGSSVLFKLPFDKNYLSVTAYLQPDVPDATRILCRWMDPYANPVYSCYGVHELCVKRIGSALQFRRYSVHRDRSTAWLALFFKTWEKMVLFHSAFVSLKARCPYTLRVNPDDYRLAGEKIMFKAQIIDDKFRHSLTIFENEKNLAIRLQAAVWDGELKRCPVWTAFVTHQSTSPQWLHRRSKHRIWLMDIRIYTFCSEYRQSHQRQRHGEFEIYFVDVEAAESFEEFFFPPEEDVIEVGGGGK